MDFIYIALPLFAVVPLYFWLSIQEHESYLESICLNFPHGRFRRSIPLMTQINSGDGAYLFESTHHDRQFIVEYRYRWKQNVLRRFTSQPALHEQLEVRFPMVQKFWLRMISRQHALNSEEAIAIGNDLDQSFSIHTNRPEAAREFMNNPYILGNFSRLIFDRLEIHRGYLRFDGRAGQTKLQCVPATIHGGGALQYCLFLRIATPHRPRINANGRCIVVSLLPKRPGFCRECSRMRKLLYSPS